MTEQEELEAMLPSEAERAKGSAAAEAIVAHVIAQGAAGCELPVEMAGKKWRVIVEIVGDAEDPGAKLN